MGFHESAFVFGDFVGRPNAGLCHGVAAVAKGLLIADAGAVPATSGAGEEPVRIAVPAPECTEACDECRGDGNFAGLAAFGVGDAQNVAFGIDVFGANMEGLAHAQAAVVDEGEVGAVASAAEGGEEFGDFFAGEDVG